MTIIDYLEASAARRPEKAAFVDADHSVSYRELKETAGRIATALIQRKIGPNAPIAVIIDRSIESICAFMGIAMSRNFYVPIDITQPVQRVSTILGKMQPELLIYIGSLSDDLKQAVTIPVAEYMELTAAEADPELISQIRKGCMDTDPLYAICTSGSTGTPKGVLISHRSVMDFIPVFVRTFHLSEEDIFGNQAPFDFDVSVKDIYSSLYLGATVQIIPRVCFSMPKKLVELLDEKQVTVIIWAVSALCIAAGLNAFKHRVPGALKKIMFSGEVMPIKMLNIWRRYFPDAMFVNLYGPTEITCNCMYYVIDREFGNTDKLPLGVPFENEGVYVLNENDQPVSVGETGEICVTGTSVGLGYYRDPEKTAAAFVQNPLNSAYPEIMYRTGDLAELAEDGNYYFAARKDFQIKHMGHRVELEEIETYMNATEGVLRASCLFDTNRNKIVACYMGEADKNSIVLSLKKDLPKYMIPNIFIRMEELPISKNGKIDRQKLKRMYEEIG